MNERDGEEAFGIKYRIHNLKTWPEYFLAIQSGEKTFELRKNDRGFKAGDILYLREYVPEHGFFTGNFLEFKVGFIIQGEWGLEEGMCVMSLLPYPEK